ncbi:uncharacterized protein LOC128244036 [Mya arenaria]|uniref:uncharacterized protein LOC128244036 n=1 Tax=Mya arenaria TaxID=6604 RepID=UPI0022E8608A|nr:uncharacterized protein LOC128244036 [Mya arenaria]
MLEEKTYTIMGKLTAMAAIYGHPGPKALSAHLVTFILRGQESTIEEISDNCFGEDVRNAIREISECSLDTAFGNNVALLEEAGFRKVPTDENKAMAISALKLHNGFYKFLGPIMQFMEGLKLHGVLEALKASSSDAEAILGISSSHTSADTVVDLFSPSYSADKEEKDNEEMIIYNFSNFLKKVERGQIETPWLNLDEPYSTKNATINMGHVLQTLLGCPRPPRNITAGTGLIEFNHKDNRLSHVNTCAPSLCFAATRSLNNYNELEKHMMHIIRDSDGFALT